MVEDFHPEVFVKADLKSSSSVANALFTVDFDFTNVTQAIENAKPPDVIAAEEAAKLAKEKAKENALINSAEKLKIAEEVKAAEEAEESERAAAADEDAEEEDDMVCISRRPPLTHNLTHSTPLPPSAGVRPRRRVRGRLRGWCERRRQAQEEGVQEGEWCLRRYEGAR